MKISAGMHQYAANEHRHADKLPRAQHGYGHTTVDDISSASELRRLFGAPNGVMFTGSARFGVDITFSSAIVGDDIINRRRIFAKATCVGFDAIAKCLTGGIVNV